MRKQQLHISSRDAFDGREVAHVAGVVFYQFVVEPSVVALYVHQMHDFREVFDVERPRFDVQKVAETRPVLCVVLYLCIAHPIESLQEQHLEHKHRFNRLAARVVFLLRVIKHGFKDVAELFKVYDFL